MSIGLKINELLEQKKLTKKDLSEKLGIARVTLDDYIKEKTSPTVNTLEKIASIFDVPIISFFEKIDDLQNSFVREPIPAYGSEIEKLQIKIKHLEEIIELKDQIIEGLKEKIRDISK